MSVQCLFHDKVLHFLPSPDVKLTGIDISTQQVLVETSLPSARVQELIETSGRQAVLMGVGSTSNGRIRAVRSCYMHHNSHCARN